MSIVESEFDPAFGPSGPSPSSRRIGMNNGTYNLQGWPIHKDDVLIPARLAQQMSEANDPALKELANIARAIRQAAVLGVRSVICEYQHSTYSRIKNKLEEQGYKITLSMDQRERSDTFTVSW